MAALINVRELGNGLLATFADGATQTLIPTPGGLWMAEVAGVPQGGGGETSSDGGNPTNNPGSVEAPIDDYPWPNAPEEDLSPLRYSYRDCTDFVAWRINRDNDCYQSPWKWTWGQLRISNGDAIGWRGDWQTHGWGVDLDPAAGLLGWYGSSAGTYGHITYIQSVAIDGVLTIEEYNWGGTQAYNKRFAAPGDRYYPDSFLAMPH